MPRLDASGTGPHDPGYPRHYHRRKSDALRIRPCLRARGAERQQGVHGCSPSIQCPRQPVLARRCACAADESGGKEGSRGWCAERRRETVPDARGEPPGCDRAVCRTGAQGCSEAEDTPEDQTVGSVKDASAGGKTPARSGETSQATARAARRIGHVFSWYAVSPPLSLEEVTPDPHGLSSPRDGARIRPVSHCRRRPLLVVNLPLDNPDAPNICNSTTQRPWAGNGIPHLSSADSRGKECVDSTFKAIEATHVGHRLSQRHANRRESLAGPG